jgi:hypothetical protein
MSGPSKNMVKGQLTPPGVGNVLLTPPGVGQAGQTIASARLRENVSAAATHVISHHYTLEPDPELLLKPP